MRVMPSGKNRHASTVQAQKLAQRAMESQAPLHHRAMTLASYNLTEKGLLSIEHPAPKLIPMPHLLVVGSHLLLILLLKAMWYPTFPNREHLMTANESPHEGVQKMSSTPSSFSWPARRRKPPASHPPLDSYVVPNFSQQRASYDS